MKIKELIDKLSKLDGEGEVRMINQVYEGGEARLGDVRNLEVVYAPETFLPVVILSSFKQQVIHGEK